MKIQLHYWSGSGLALGLSTPQSPVPTPQPEPECPVPLPPLGLSAQSQASPSLRLGTECPVPAFFLSGLRDSSPLRDCVYLGPPLQAAGPRSWPQEGRWRGTETTLERAGTGVISTGDGDSVGRIATRAPEAFLARETRLSAMNRPNGLSSIATR